MTVIATAGHVDHGKSTLVKFLTNQETDRLVEEKKRGLTINLGYTYFEINNEIISIVDVPGHKDYFKNTVSGFSNVDGILFCIDATQGWSQQSEEHIQSIKWLGINNILFVITKIDLLKEKFNTSKLEEKIKEFKLKNFNIIEYSSKNSDVTKLRNIVFETFSKERSSDSQPHMWVDRSFVIDGVGKVITGTSHKNFLLDIIYCDEELLDIRDTKSTKESFKVALSSKRVAISLKKNKNESIGRGSLLTNDKLKSYRYFLLKYNETNETFNTKGDIRIYFGTNNQVIKNIYEMKIDSNLYCLIELSTPLPGLLKNYFLLHNLKYNSFFGGEAVFATNNTHLIKNLIKHSKSKLDASNAQIFTLVPKLLNNSENYLSIDQFVISQETISKIETELNQNFELINKTGVDKYFEQKYFIDSENILNVFNHFSNLSFIKNQLQKVNILEIDFELLTQISQSLTIGLEVNEINLATYDKEATKKLFMNSYLFRVSPKIVITKEHKNLLINIVNSLKDEFSVSDFKNAANLTRKYAIPYLEFLDKSGVTAKIDQSGTRKKLV